MKKLLGIFIAAILITIYGQMDTVAYDSVSPISPPTSPLVTPTIPPRLAPLPMPAPPISPIPKPNKVRPIRRPIPPRDLQ